MFTVIMVQESTAVKLHVIVKGGNTGEGLGMRGVR